MEGAPKFTYDFVMGQLRIALVAGLAFAGGKGWLTPTDAGAITAIATGLGPLVIPWICSVYANLGVVHVGSGSAAATLAKVEAVAPVAAANAANKVADTIVKVLIAAVLLSAFLFADPAMAQQQRGPIGQKIHDDLAGRTGIRGDGPLEDIIGALDAKLLPDLQYALKLATASGSKVTAPCYQAWIDIINVRQKAVQGPDGQDMVMPDPAVVTKFEKLVELRNSLQPDSEFMIKCSPVASMVKKDIVSFIGVVISGGAGLATLVPGL